MTDDRSPDAAESYEDEERSLTDDSAADQADAPQTVGPNDRANASVQSSAEWFQDDTASRPGVPRLGEIRDHKKFEDRQYWLAITLIALYGAGNACVIVGWFLHMLDSTAMLALVSNLGTLVAAVVAFYFAESKKR